MIMPIRLISVDLLTRSVFSGKPQISKYFKLSNFSPPQSRRIAWAVEIERYLFSGEMYRHTIAYRAYKVERHCAHQVPSLPTLAFKSTISHLLFAAPHPLLLRNG
jgi:hypothetical protein